MKIQPLTDGLVKTNTNQGTRMLEPGVGTGKTIALLIDSLSGMGSYQEDIWKGVSAAVKEAGARLLIFPGGMLGHSPESPFEKNRNIVYNLVTPDYVDGIIVAGGTIGNFITQQELFRFITAYAPLPVVSVGGKIEGVSTVIIDNESGFSRLLEHLIMRHARRKIAFIRGPAGNEDAEKRFAVYRQVLANHSIAFDEKRVFLGTFIEHSGHEAVRTFLDERQCSFDAVAAANDNMALGALKELLARGAKVPEDVAVIGFDDAFESRIINPPLSTIRQPVIEQAAKAVETLFDLMTGDVTDTVEIFVETEMVIRRSCGCAGVERHEKITVEAARETDPAGWMKSAVAVFRSRCRLAIEEESLEQLSRNFLKAVTEEHFSVFLPDWYDFLDRSFVRLEDLETFKCFLATFRETMLAAAASGEKKSLEDLLFLAHDLFVDKVSRLSVQRMTQLQTVSRQVSHVGTLLGGAFDRARIADVLYEALPSLQINSFLLALYQDTTDPFRSLSVIVRVDQGRRIEIPREGLFVPAYALFSSDFIGREPRSQNIIFPLYFKDEQLGLVILEVTAEFGFVYETIFSQLCTAIESALLFEKNTTVRLETEARSREIEGLSLPMIDSIGEISTMTDERMKIVQDLVLQTKDSGAKISETNANIDKITAHTSRLMDIIKIIEEISERVNLLALNTSIEAAHVGKYGVGFAVIAKEIKQLSENTRKHSIEIAGTLNEIIRYTRDTSQFGRESVESFTVQEKGIAQIMAAFEAINAKMRKLGESSALILKLIQ